MNDVNNHLNKVPMLHHRYYDKLCIQIIEQPAEFNGRFRYESEGRSSSYIHGVNSSKTLETFPAVKLKPLPPKSRGNASVTLPSQDMIYSGPCLIIASLSTKDSPYRAHPNKLSGAKHCELGFYYKIVDNPQEICSFENLSIIRSKKNAVEESLKTRKECNVDPFGNGFKDADNIDLDVVRLCFQVYILGPDNQYSIQLKPVVSNPIYNKRTDLRITKLSHSEGPASGGTDVILLCERVEKENTEIWFYETRGSEIVWQIQAEFEPGDVHKQVAISFKTPSYYNENVDHDVPVFVQLRKKGENKRGDPLQFIFFPTERGNPPVLVEKENENYSISLSPFMSTPEIVPVIRRQSSHQSVRNDSIISHQSFLTSDSSVSPTLIAPSSDFFYPFYDAPHKTPGNPALQSPVSDQIKSPIPDSTGTCGDTEDEISEKLSGMEISVESVTMSQDLPGNSVDGDTSIKDLISVTESAPCVAPEMTQQSLKCHKNETRVTEEEEKIENIILDSAFMYIPTDQYLTSGSIPSFNDFTFPVASGQTEQQH